MTTWIKVILVNLVVIAGLLLALEGGVRFTLPHINPQHGNASLLAADRFAGSYGYKPNARGLEWGVEMVTDEHGFRIDPNFMPANAHRTMLVVGDSVSVGLGVAAGDTYSSRLQQAWPDVRILNASVTGYDLADYANVLEAVLPTQPVEGIILGLCLNDVIGTSQANILSVLSKQADQSPSQDLSPNTGQEANHQQSEAQRPPQMRPIEVSRDRYPNPIVWTLRYLNDNYFNFNETLKRHSRTYLWLKSLATDTSRDYFQADALAYRDEATMATAAQALARVKRVAEQHHVWLVAFILPYEYQLRRPTPEQHFPQRQFLDATRQAGIPTYDLLEDLWEALDRREGGSTGLYLFNDPMHFSAEGHRLVAKLIREKLHERGLISDVI